jgi:hypothetical protein
MNSAPFSFRPSALDQGSLGLTEEYIRRRAYQFYEQRGRQDGHDVEDWLRAEAEIFGKKSPTSENRRRKETAHGHARAHATA